MYQFLIIFPYARITVIRCLTANVDHSTVNGSNLSLMSAEEEEYMKPGLSWEFLLFGFEDHKAPLKKTLQKYMV